MLSALLVSIALLFVLGLILKKFFLKNLCALCFGVSLVWIAALVPVKLSMIELDPALLALLIGTSVTGISYFVMGKMSEALKVFTLPFFLSVLSIGAFLLVPESIARISVFLVLAALWLIALGFYLLRTNPNIKKVFNYIIECCKNF
ncbi:MAG: hypothetical protein Q8P45_00690 [Candidatus Harrisonbacteria bacterium]|nr:hypothetical protein [Candidatus Harrisonbacteria bacterium]